MDTQQASRFHVYAEQSQHDTDVYQCFASQCLALVEGWRGECPACGAEDSLKMAPAKVRETIGRGRG